MPATGIGAARPSGPVAKAQPQAAAQSARPVGDSATIMGIPRTELTPKVQQAINQLMLEVQNLREELRQAHKRITYLEQLADEDSLVPVANRRAFVRELTRMISFAERYDTPGSVLFFDVNNMKQINDRYGHGAGDAALKLVATVLREGLRASDVVGRLGGDEFGVILAQADQARAHAKALSLVRSIAARPLSLDGEAYSVAVAFGIHTFAGGEKVDDALEAADRAMYAHKRANGRAR